MKNNHQIKWPQKYSLLGIGISAINYNELLEKIIVAARYKKSVLITHLAVHGVIEGNQDYSLRKMLNEFEIVAPDGQPVRKALDLLYNIKLPDRCYGPELMRQVCQRAEVEEIGIYLYGSHSYVIDALVKNLLKKHPLLKINGWKPSAFRPLTNFEDDNLVRSINESDARIVFIGLGCPLQERFAYQHIDKINAVQICVGAAFDFLSNNKKMAPSWMQKYSLEWFFRLSQEPGRLWRRYLFTNMIFIYKLLLQYMYLKLS